MWSQYLLCLLVGLAFANNPGWKDKTEYTYEVRGRTLASLHDVSNEHSGIFLKAKLIVRPKSDGSLDCKITEPQYAQIHAPLPGNWEAYVPDSQLQYQHLPISEKPFKIETKNGAIRDLIVSRDITNWEANFIKSIASQFQLDTQAENVISSHINILTQEGTDTAVFKTMEETVTGVSETLYEIHPLPEYELQTKPWMAPKPELRENGDYIEVVKTKNFTNSGEIPSYYYGFTETHFTEPTGNKMGDFMSRTSVSRAVITGTLERYVIQSAITVDSITVSPTFNDKQRGSVTTLLNMTLLSVQPGGGHFEEIPNSVNLGTLVYRYDDPFSPSNEPRPGKSYEHEISEGSAESYRKTKDSGYGRWNRLKRSTPENDIYSMSFPSYYSGESSSEEQHYYWEQDKPELHQAPPAPLLPFTVGYEGQSYKKAQNVIEQSRKLAQRIAQEIQRPSEIPHKNTVGKYVTLCALLRIMDESEMQQVASQLYTQEQYGHSATAWKIYRDAVAEAGTGPALLTIQEFIKSKKLQDKEDAQIIQALAHSTRQPTEDYMKTFYEMVKSPEVMEHPYFNETALLAYTELVHEVYINLPTSHSKFPVHSFGKFYTVAGKKFVKSEIIPYLTEKLHNAITKADTEKIHVYIRALGNIGHRRILEAFEPYLEGNKKCSHFQRVLMVLALDKLVTAKPVVARSVLYKIYQNPSEYDKVRVAAVYQLMRTNPPPAMLQRMASYTNADPSEYVNSAVKSSIEYAAQLKGSEYAQLRYSAESAKHLLTEKPYGVQYSHNHLRSYIMEEMKLTYKQSFHSYGHDDHILPEGISYKLRGRFGGLRQYLVYSHAFVSSVDDLYSVFEQTTEDYKKQQQQKDAENSGNQKWSSERIAKLLNIQFDQREGLEGNLYFKMGHIQKMLAFDNTTIEILPRVMQEIEQSLRNGKKFNLHKYIIDHEIAVAFPTAMGFPFIYTYDKPVFINVEGKVRASASPEISTGNGFTEPKSVKSEFEIRVLVSGKTQSQLGFITPFDHKRYTAGYDKNFQVHVPLSGSVDYDVEKSQTKVELKGLEDQHEQNYNLVHFSSWPYTSKDDIYSLEPQHKIIQKKYPHKTEHICGDKAIGIAFQMQITSDEHVDIPWVYKKLSQHDPISALLSPWIDDKIQHVEMNLNLDPQRSPNKKVVVRFGTQHRYRAGRANEARGNKVSIEKLGAISEEPLKRQYDFVQWVGEGINNVHSRVYDVNVEFEGSQQIKYTATLGASKSNVDPDGKVLFQMQKKGGETGPFFFRLAGLGSVPNTNGLDYNYAMSLDPTSIFEFEAAVGETYEKSTRFNSRVKYTRSEERKQYLAEHPEVKECLRQMQEGNHQLPACAKMTARANLLDKFYAKFDYQNVQPEIVNATFKLGQILQHYLYPSVDVNVLGHGKPHSFEFEGKFEPDFEYVNMSIAAEKFRAHVHNIPVHKWAKAALVPHPVFHVRARLMGEAYKYPVYRPICVLDKTAASTFDNKTYPVTLPSDWTVLLQYVTRRPSPGFRQPTSYAEKQIKQQIESYTVLARPTTQGSEQREIKITLQTPKTGEKYVEITLKPTASGQYPKLLVGGEEIKYNIKEAADIYGGYIQAYGLPNNEIKVEIYKAFYIIFDGVRAKLTIVDNKFRGAVQGLCGTYTGEPETDFLAPQDCILRHPEEFVHSYTVSESGNPKIVPYKKDSDKCYKKKVEFANVISSADVGRTSGGPGNPRPVRRGSCTKHQTQYVEESDEICFTVRPLPVCKSGCNQRGSIQKQVEVHCISNDSRAKLWAKEIEKGASPDFSSKQPTKTIQMYIPEGCSP